MRRIAAVTMVVLGVLVCAAPGAQALSVGHRGEVTGDLKAGKVFTVRIVLTHPRGWQSVQGMVVALRLRGRSLDQIQFNTSQLSLSIEGDGGPWLLGQRGSLRGPFFEVDNANVSIQASGKRLGLTLPIKLAAAPPPGARLFYTYNALGVSAPGYLAITPPVRANGGFSWGTLGVAVAVALFAGGFAGNLVASNRRRQQRPSIYATVQRRLEEERTPR